MTEQPAIRVLIVHASAVVRGGLQYYLQAHDDIVVVGEAADAPQALALAEALTPDVVLIDTMLSDMAGISVTRQLRQGCPQVRVLAFGERPDGELVQRALRAGAIGYLITDIASDELATAIRQAYSGQAVLAPALAQALVIHDQQPKLGAQLSVRELEVLGLMISGRSNEHIAGQLAISRNTVRHHVHNILTKLGAANRTEAVGLAVQHKLVAYP
jgi:NarL family two-component system response regulator LiaR